MDSITVLFKLLRAAVGIEDLCPLPHDANWHDVYELSIKQCIDGVAFDGLQTLLRTSPDVKQNLDSQENEDFKYEVFCGLLEIEDWNTKLNQCSAELSKFFKDLGFRSCILKGQGLARLYPAPLHRVPGDIDIWIEGEQDNIINALKDNGKVFKSIDYVHSKLSFFDDVPVEVHFRPSWLYNPFANTRLQSFFIAQSYCQFSNIDEELGFAYPDAYFNLVHSLIHINKHCFEEGIGLKQLMDLYMIVRQTCKAEREEAMRLLDSFNLSRFVGAVMYVLKEVMLLDDDYLLCDVNEKYGSFLLSEIMKGGNFGQHDSRNQAIFDSTTKLQRNWNVLLRDFRYVTLCPHEVLWIPIWKVWHWFWRKRKHYL